MRRLLVVVGIGVGLVLPLAACTSGDDASGDTLFTTTVAPPTTTTLPPTITTAPPTTTTVPPTTTTSSTTTTTVAATTTTTLGTEVLESMEGSTAGTLEELPLTGFEPEVLALSLLALVTGTWLVRWSGAWDRLIRLRARAWRRPDAPVALLSAEPIWPPTALEPISQHDVEFRRSAHHLAELYGVSVLGGIDAYASRIAPTLSPEADPQQLAAAVDELNARDEWVAPLDKWTTHLALEVARIYRR